MGNSFKLIRQSWSYYRRFYRLVAGAVILLMAVLTGSLLLGDSVRGTLVQRVSERLGQTETLIASGTGFMSEDILRQPLLASAQGYLLVDGFIAVDDKLLPVYVWGTDADTLKSGEALINEPLSRKLGNATDIVLHLPSHSLVPSGSLFVTQSYATQMRLQVKGTKSVKEGGNLLLKNEQTLPLNIFINRQQLAEEMELEGKVNIILSEVPITDQQLSDVWQPAYSGIHLTDSSLTYDGIFIPEEVVNSITMNNGDRPHYSRYFSYLVNDIIHAQDTVPYSFVTAVTEWQGEALTGQDIILSDYASEHLHVSVGDSVRMSYFLAQDLKNLQTREQLFCVKRIIPLADFQQDSLLMADFPGLSHVERCADWDSDLPIKMDHIHKVDEDFWYQYHQTPKALVAYDAVQGDWTNSFGSATALRIPAEGMASAREALHSQDFLTVVSPRQHAIESAKSGVDFASLFMALGFFIILSAILLMQNPLLEMFSLRRHEIVLYRQMGYSQKRVSRLFFREAFTIIGLTSPIGVLAGLLYSWLTLWLLGNVWSGATHTEGFALHINAWTIVAGWLAGLLICAVLLAYTLHKMMREHVEKPSSKVRTSYSWIIAVGSLVLTITLIVLNFMAWHSMVLFIVCGLMWIITFGLLLRVFIQRKVARQQGKGWCRRQMVWQSIYASMHQHLVAYWSLSMGVFTVFAVGLNRPDFSDADNIQQATGGYQYYVDCRVPIQYDLNQPEVRQKLSLTQLPDSTVFLPFLRHTLDEASCLNLNKVSTPTVLGVDLNKMSPFGLTHNNSDSYFPSGVGGAVDSYSPSGVGGAVGASIYLDEESLIWSLMKSVGDTLYYNTRMGEHTPVVIAGSYPTGIFHGCAIMDSEDFRRIWPDESGIEVLLIHSPHPDEAADILSVAMNEYGLNVQTVEERLQMFFEVTETYLIIFLTLGGLGLLLGIFSLFIIVRKNLTAHRDTISLYHAMGYPRQAIHQQLLHENSIVPLYAIVVGTIGSVISISANITGAGLSSILGALLCFTILCISVYYGIKSVIKRDKQILSSANSH